MLYLLAAIGAICVAVLLWRAFVANPTTVSQRRVTRPDRPTRPTRSGPIAPDDDPEFLRELGKKNPPDTDSTPPA